MKLFKGMSWRKYKRLLDKRFLRDINILKDIEVGSILHDCDGFNHRVAEINVHKSSQCYGTWYIDSVDIVREDGDFFCGCSPPQKPHTVKQIEEYHLSWDCPEALKIATDWNFNNIPFYIAKLKQGFPITDKDGLPLLKLKE